MTLFTNVWLGTPEGRPKMDRQPMMAAYVLKGNIGSGDQYFVSILNANYPGSILMSFSNDIVQADIECAYWNEIMGVPFKQMDFIKQSNQDITYCVDHHLKWYPNKRKAIPEGHTEICSWCGKGIRSSSIYSTVYHPSEDGYLMRFHAHCSIKSKPFRHLARKEVVS